MAGKDKKEYSESYLIEKEKQKTRRMRNMYIFFGVITLAGIFVIYMVVMKSGGKGDIDLNLSEGSFKFSIDKPVVEQAKTETKTFKTQDGKSVDYTTGKISQQFIDDFSSEDISFSPEFFTGENLINEQAGYIISSTIPDIWTVLFDQAALYQEFTPINTLMASDGSHLNVGRGSISHNSIVDFVNASVNEMIMNGEIADYPYVSYADDGRTAFLTFTNYATNGQSYFKIIQGDMYYYIATANYNLDITDVDIQDELIWMVANFTLIE